jgi:hypothetical protein
MALATAGMAILAVGNIVHRRRQDPDPEELEAIEA